MSVKTEEILRNSKKEEPQNEGMLTAYVKRLTNFYTSVTHISQHILNFFI